MRSTRLLAQALAVSVFATPLALAQQQPHQNRVIDLIIQKKQIIGLQIPSLPGGRGRAGGRGGVVRDSAAAAAAATTTQRTARDIAAEVLDYGKADYMFTGAMERRVASGIDYFSAFSAGLTELGSVTPAPGRHLRVPLAAKTPVIHSDTLVTVSSFSSMLNAGLGIAILPQVLDAAEVRRGISAMRFRANGGTRPDDVGSAPAHWGLTEAQYKEKADVWPLNPNGELVAWVIIETREALANLDAIASEKGVSALIVGAGTLRGVFSGDPAGAEAATQQILAACRKHSLACGYPTNARDIEARTLEGFRIHVLQQWGEGAFQTVEIGRRAGGG